MTGAGSRPDAMTGGGAVAADAAAAIATADPSAPGVPELARALAAGETTSVALVRRALERAEASGATFITLDAEGALASAAESDRRRAAGAPRSAIDGIPTAVKDVIDTAGLRTTMASEFFRDHVSDRDAAIVGDLRGVGAVIIGKTNAQEFSYGIRGDAGAFGRVPNPFDPARVAGGSSSGSAAAVATGIVPFAVGSDTAGSIRIPAALCGVAGLKPTLGLLDTTGAFPLAATFDTLGYLATDAAGIELVLRETGALPGAGADDDARADSDALGGSGAIPDRPRFLALDAMRRSVVDAAAGAPFDAAVGLTAAATAELPRLDGADIDFAELYRIVRAREAYLLHAERARTAPERFQPEVLANVRSGADITDAQVAEARERIDRARAAMAAAFAPGDLLLSPTTPILAPLPGERSASGPLASLTVIWNVLGWPAIAVPMRVPGCALPQSLQIVGRPGEDRAVLRAARRLEAALAGE